MNRREFLLHLPFATLALVVPFKRIAAEPPQEHVHQFGLPACLPFCLDDPPKADLQKTLIPFIKG